MAFALFDRYAKKHERNLESTILNDGLSEMESKYYEMVSKGSTKYRIASVSDQYDIMVLKSLLQSEQIPYYFEFENTSKLVTGLPDFNDKNPIINILDDDYEDALKVLERYVEDKLDDNRIGSKELSSSNRNIKMAELNDYRGIKIYKKNE